MFGAFVALLSWARAIISAVARWKLLSIVNSGDSEEVSKERPWKTLAFSCLDWPSQTSIYWTGDGKLEKCSCRPICDLIICRLISSLFPLNQKYNKTDVLDANGLLLPKSVSKFILNLRMISSLCPHCHQRLVLLLNLTPITFKWIGERLPLGGILENIHFHNSWHSQKLSAVVSYFQAKELWLSGGLACHWPDPARAAPVGHNIIATITTQTQNCGFLQEQYKQQFNNTPLELC